MGDADQLRARQGVGGFLHERVGAVGGPTGPRLEACGYVFLAHSDERLRALSADVALQNEVGVPSRILAPAELAELVHGLDVSEVTGAAYCAEDGYFDEPQALVEASRLPVGAAASVSSTRP